MTIQEPLAALAAALRRLASPATEQVEYLAGLGVADLVDELALEFDDAYRPRLQLLHDVSPDAESICAEIDALISSDALGWTFADLDSADWAAVRSAAEAALAALDRDAEAAR